MSGAMLMKSLNPYFFYRQSEHVLLTKNLKGNPKVYMEYIGEDQA